VNGVPPQRPQPPGPADDAERLHLSFLERLPLTRRAAAYAQRLHARQRRPADGASFLLHPLEVASLLERSHYPDHVVAAATLHDVLEDTDAERWELERSFGPEVAGLVAAVSDDPAIADEEARKDDLRERVRALGGYAAAIYAADKISKVRELRALLAAGLGDAEAEVKRERHRRSLEMLDETIPGSRLVELLRFEVEALDELPPAS
jgi:(p)ppGpp synthase/HD superfamily hydrolase